MEATSEPGGEDPRMEQPEILKLDDQDLQDDDSVDETIEHPAKVMRVGTMMKQLLEEVRAAGLDEASRDRLKEIYETSVEELGSALSEDLRNELGRLALSFGEGEAPSADELRIAQAQLVGLPGALAGVGDDVAQLLLDGAQPVEELAVRRSRRGQWRPTEPG